MTKQSATSFGKEGEEAAAFLKKKDYRILEMNFRTKTGEIDIVAEHRRKLAFIELKTRSKLDYGQSEAALNEAK